MLLAGLAFRGHAFSVLNGMVLVSILSTIALPYAVTRNRNVATTVSGGIAVAILIAYPVAKNYPLESQIADAISADVSGADFTESKRVAYYSVHKGSECGNVCLKFLIDGDIDTFTAYEMEARTGRRHTPSGKGHLANPKRIGAGVTYRLEKRTICPNPLDEGASGRRANSAIWFSLAGTCLIGTPANRNNSDDLHIVFEQHPSNAPEFERGPYGVRVKYRKQIKRFFRLWVLKSAGQDEIHFTGDNVLARQTKIKYEKLVTPFLFPVRKEVRVGNWIPGKTGVDEVNTDTAALFLLSDFFPDERPGAAGRPLPRPAARDLLTNVTKQLPYFDELTPRSRQAQTSWRNSLRFIYNDRKFRNAENISAIVDFSHAVLLAGARHIRKTVNTLPVSALDTATLDWALLEVAFHSTFKLRHSSVYTYRDGLSAD